MAESMSGSWGFLGDGNETRALMTCRTRGSPTSIYIFVAHVLLTR